MYVVGHEAVCPYVHLVLGTPVGHEVKIGFIIFFSEKCQLPPVATLGNMVGKAGGNYPC